MVFWHEYHITFPHAFWLTESCGPGYAYGPWAYKTPNAVNFDFTDDKIEYDFSLLTSGYEMPYNEAQVF